jgi:HrpA-like RNA helicase
MAEALGALRESPEFQPMLKQRQGLPAWTKQQEIVDAVSSSQVRRR